MAACHACPAGDNTLPDRDILDHVRLAHPALWDGGPDTWPDGALVVVDVDPEPDDFGAAA
jgi:hypothetical protein